MTNVIPFPSPEPVQSTSLDQLFAPAALARETCDREGARSRSSSTTNVIPFPSPQLVQRTPFNHLFAPAVLTRETCDRVIDALEAATAWEALADPRIDAPPGARLAGTLPPSLALLEGPALLTRLKGWLTRTYGVTFTDRCDLEVGRFTEGHQIYPHVDDVPEGCTHRAVMFLTRNWSWEDGGCLWLLGSPFDPMNSPGNACYPPIAGNVVLFEVSPRAFHAVGRLKKGVRYSLSYSFYADKTQ